MAPDVDSGAGAAMPCTTERNLLGEGARWDGRRNELLRLDILAGLVYRDRVADDGALTSVFTYAVPGPVVAIAPVRGDDGWLITTRHGLSYLAVDGVVRPIAEVAPAGTRMNGASCDPQGRLWAGTCADDHHPGRGVIYRFDQDGRIEAVLDGLTTPDGLAWSVEGDTMYVADSSQRMILAFAFDGESGRISAGRIAISVAAAVGAPGGITVDAAGDLWVAIIGGGQVHRYTPDGDLREVFTVPAKRCTSCAFAGQGLRHVYVTTATATVTATAGGWAGDRDPAAGLVYRLDTRATGRPASPYAPRPRWWRAVTGGAA